MHRNESSSHGDILLGANLGIVVGPALSGVVQKNDPEQIKIRPIVNKDVGVPVPLWGYDWNRRVELKK